MNYIFIGIVNGAADLRHCILSGSLVVVTLLVSPAAMAGMAYSPFGSAGEGGTVNGQFLSFGSGGEVYELDAFVNIAGMDLNGPSGGSSAQLSRNPLPIGMVLGFSVALSADQSDLVLTYTLTNTSGGSFPSMWFATFVDAEIDVAINGYFNEAADQFGTLGVGPSDSAPDEWEADEPGYVVGDIYTHLLAGALDGSNGVPSLAPDDASLAIGFQLGNLGAGHVATVRIMLSDSGNTLGDFGLQHFDADIESFDVLTVSGTAQLVAVPEPATLLPALIAAGMITVVTICQHPRRRATSNLWERVS